MTLTASSLQPHGGAETVVNVAESCCDAAMTELVVRGACPHDCPDTCAWTVTVRDGRAVEMRGDPDHSFTRGGLCAKVNRFLEDRTYNPARLLHPLRRVGA